MGFPEDLAIVEQSLGYSLHLVVFLLRFCAVLLLVVEGLDEWLKFHDLDHVEILQILSKDRVHVLPARLVAIGGSLGWTMTANRYQSLQFLLNAKLRDVFLEAHEGIGYFSLDEVYLSVLVHGLEEIE